MNWQDKLSNVKMITPFKELDIWQYMLDMNAQGKRKYITLFDYLDKIGFVRGNDVLTTEQATVLRYAIDHFFCMLRHGKI